MFSIFPHPHSLNPIALAHSLSMSFLVLIFSLASFTSSPARLPSKSVNLLVSQPFT